MVLKFFRWPDEFSCKCGCGFADFDERLAILLDRIREEVGRPIIIRSGCRCPKHNASVGGKPDSDHLTGNGVDVPAITDSYRYSLIMEALRFGINRIGIAKTFLHLGLNPNKPAKIWLYDNE